jgi:hypothetical protein
LAEPAPLLTLAVSTLGERAERLAAWPVDPRVRLLALWQAPAASAPRLPPAWTLARLPGRGVAASRNAAIARCTTPWLWFLDDDVEVPAASLDHLLAELPRRRAEEVLIGTLETLAARPRKVRRDGARYRRHHLLQVGTVQIVCHAGFARAVGARFPLALGAGAALPACDEPVFLDRLRRAGAEIRHEARLIVRHPEHSSGQALADEAALLARAAAFSALYGRPAAAALALAFWGRNARSVGPRFPALFHFRAAEAMMRAAEAAAPAPPPR